EELVQQTRSRSGRGANRGFHQAGACPVIKLPVGDPCGFACYRSAKAGCLIDIGESVTKKHSLNTSLAVPCEFACSAHAIHSPNGVGTRWRSYALLLVNLWVGSALVNDPPAATDLRHSCAPSSPSS